MLIAAGVLLCSINVGLSVSAKKEYPECCPYGVDACESNTDTTMMKLSPGLFVDKDYWTHKSVGFFVKDKLKNMRKMMAQRPKNGMDTPINGTPFNDTPINDTSTGNSTSTRRKRQTSCNCCQTVYNYVAPFAINISGVEYDVVQYDDIESYQVFTQGVCQTSSCSASTQCVDYLRLVWVLIWIPCPWEPDMEWVPVYLPSHCVCQS